MPASSSALLASLARQVSRPGELVTLQRGVVCEQRGSQRSKSLRHGTTRPRRQARGRTLKSRRVAVVTFPDGSQLDVIANEDSDAPLAPAYDYTAEPLLLAQSVDSVLQGHAPSFETSFCALP